MAENVVRIESVNVAAGTSLSAVTGNSTGAVIDTGTAHGVWSVHSVSTGTLTGTVHLLVSADGVSFFDVASGAVPAGSAFASTFTVAARYGQATLTGVTGAGTITSKIMAA